MKTNFILLVGIILLTACSAVPTVITAPTQTSQPMDEIIPAPTYSLSSPCGLAPITVPVMPKIIPGYTEEDPATGLHMTGKPMTIDLNSYYLKISGLVEKPLQLNYEEIRCLPKVTAKPTLICPGFFMDTTTWSGVTIASLLEKAGVKKGAKQIVMVSADGYQTQVPIEDALDQQNFLAYEWMGQPVPVLHGFPIRAVFPQLDGNEWAKWLLEIRVE